MIAQRKEAGLLVPPGDPVALSEAIIRVLEDPDLLQRLRLGCRKEAGRFSIDTYTARLEELTAEVRGAHRPALMSTRLLILSGSRPTRWVGASAPMGWRFLERSCFAASRFAW